MLERMLVFALLPLAAHAATILYSDSGTFSGSTPSTAFSAPNQTWAFSFQADSNPSIVEFGNGGFDFAFSNFSYVLNGSPVAITPTAIRFFTAANGGGFFICFGALPCGNGVFPNGLGTGGPQLYSGPNSAPTLLSGPFTSLPFTVTVNSISYNQANTTLQAAATQHPAFFSGEVDLSAGVYYLQFPNGNLFGYYNYSAFPYLYHYDLGFEYFLDANDSSHGIIFTEASPAAIGSTPVPPIHFRTCTTSLSNQSSIIFPTPRMPGITRPILDSFTTSGRVRPSRCSRGVGTSGVRGAPIYACDA